MRLAQKMLMIQKVILKAFGGMTFRTFLQFTLILVHYVEF